MKPFFEFSEAQKKTLTLLGIVVLVAGSYLLVRDYYPRPSDQPHDWQDEGLDQYQPVLILDANFSPADSLELIPGIGPVTAQRIVDYRREHGVLVSVDSLINVPGIGPEKMKRIKRYFKVSHR